MTLMASLVRCSTGDSGTYGVFSVPGFRCFSGELPWRNNTPKLSCIEEGEYEVRLVKSPRFGNVYGLFGTKGRSHVLIHRGNFSGDITKGYVSNVEGCIILGNMLGRIQTAQGRTQSAVLTSAPTVRSFMEHLGGQLFKLRVTSSYGKSTNQGDR